MKIHSSFAGLILLGEYKSVTFPNIPYNLERFGICELNVSLESKIRTQCLQQEAQLDSETSRQASYWSGH